MLDDEKPKVSLSEPEVPVDDEELVNIEDLTELDTEELANEESDEINEVDELRAENAELNDRLMRALAEAENQRKRGERDRRDAEVYGGRKLARDLLSVYDNMKRASEMATDEQREANKSLFEGIDLTQRELINTFAKHNIVPIAPEVGDKFDPELHQAMFEAPMPTVKAGHILQVLDEGFMISDRLLRPANVGVSSGG
ncbi:nucleotide exchange factor GrpE [Amylibacter sp.]|nr:nucleotide exchange factor GrpE [Amylibacter sp.]